MFLEIFGVHLLRFSQVPRYLVCRTTRPVLVLKFQVSQSFYGYVVIRCTKRTHIPFGASYVMYVTLMCSIRVKLWSFVILLDFFIPLYFITVQENRKNRKLRKQKIAQKDFCKQWNDKQYTIRIQRSLNYSPQQE